MSKFKQFMRDEEGATAIEYALIVAVIALVMYVGAKVLGTSLSSFFGTSIVGKFTSATS